MSSTQQLKEKQLREKEERERKAKEAKEKLKAQIAKRKEEARIKKEQERLAREEAERLAVEKRKKVSAERKARIAAEKKKREEEERLAREEAERIKEEKHRLAVQKQKETIERAKREKELQKQREEIEEEESRLLEQQKIQEKKKSILRSTESAKSKKQLEEEERARIKEEEERKQKEKLASIKRSAAASKQKKLERERLQREEREERERIKREKEQQAIEKLKATKAAARKKREEKEAAKQEEPEEDGLSKEELAKLKLKEKIAAKKRENAEKKAREAEERRLEKERKAAEIAKAKEEQKALIARVKAEAAQKKKEEEALKKAEKEKIEQERKEKEKERRARRKLELEAKKLQKQKEEEERRRLETEAEKEKIRIRKEKAEKRKIELEKLKKEQEEKEKEEQRKAEEIERKLAEEQRIAREKHAAEVKKLLEEQRDLEEEEKKKVEEEKHRLFLEEQEKRQKELADFIEKEKIRKKKAKERIAKLNLQNRVVNKVGLFTNFGEEPGLEIWSIGDDQISKLAKLKHGLRGIIGENHGSFHVEKCYVVLFTQYQKGLYNYNLHSWTGSLAEDWAKKQLKQRINELEEGLIDQNLEVLQHEYEGEETDLFKSYFPNDIEYVQPVNLKNTKGPNYIRKRLYHIKGRNHVHAKRVEPIPENLNSGDVFILEDNDAIYQFNGLKCNKMEKGKALDMTIQMRIERNARVRVVIIEQDHKDNLFETKRFWASLMLDPYENEEHALLLKKTEEATGVIGATPDGLEEPVKSAEEGGDDEEAEMEFLNNFKFIRVEKLVDQDNDNNNNENAIVNYQTIEMPLNGREPHVDMLNSNYCYILDCETETFLWFGKNTSDDYRRFTKSEARKLTNDRPLWTKIHSIRQETEPVIFKEKFVGSWGEYADFDFSEHVWGNVADLKQEDINIDRLYYPTEYAPVHEDSDRLAISNYDPKENGELEIFLVTNFEKYEIPKSEFGHFYTGNCYVLLYTKPCGEDRNGKPLTKSVVYFWQGIHSSREDRGLSALIAGDVGKKLRLAKVCRVVQNKEPVHFLSHFNPIYVVSLGKRQVDDKDAGKHLPSSNTHLYQIRGICSISAHAVETRLSADSLTSSDSFLVISSEGNSNQNYLFIGKYSNEHEIQAANKIAALSSNPLTTIKEADNNIPNSFWSLFENGKSDYCQSSHLHNTKPRLYHCSNSIGIYRVVEITFDNVHGDENNYSPFAQTDLSDRDVMIIDGDKEIFIWCGPSSNEKCKNDTIDVVNQMVAYNENNISARPNIPINIVEAGEETINFRAYFHSWNFQDKYQSDLNHIKNNNNN